jgi:hypothetical protein
VLATVALQDTKSTPKTNRPDNLIIIFLIFFLQFLICFFDYVPFYLLILLGNIQSQCQHCVRRWKFN